MIETGWQQEILRIEDRKPGEDGVALNRRRIFAWRQEFIAEAFCEFFEGLAEHDLHSKALANLVADAAVA